MAYRLEGNEIVIDGWENGISDNPYKGINDMRGVNIVSTPGEASVSFSSEAQRVTPCTGTVDSADAGTDIVSISILTGSLYANTFGQAVVFTGASLPGGLTAATVYWIYPQSGNVSFKVYDGSGVLVDITSNGTGTFATVNLVDIKYFDDSTGAGIDSSGRVWIPSGSDYIFSGNSLTSASNGNGIIYWRGYLFAFKNDKIDYRAFTPGSFSLTPWTAGWQTFNTASGTNNPHDSIIALGDVVYITDGSYICKLEEVTGKTFSPTDASTYIFTTKAFLLPKTDTALSIEQLGIYILIGGSQNYIYKWDRTSTSYNDAVKITDNGIYKLLTVNTNTYAFAGKRGRIYKTNGSQAELYKKIPDHISGGPDPVFIWQNVAYFKNQIYFGISATNNAGTALTSYAGLWAIDITTEALRVPALCSTATATVSAIYADASNNTGFSLTFSWKTASTKGLDISVDDPYSTYVAYIETDVIPVGQFLKKRSFENIEFKLTAPLITNGNNNERIKISARSSKFGTYTQIGEAVGGSVLGGVYTLNFDQLQWLQFKIEMQSLSINQSPSFVRLYELRLR